jgi:ATP-binding cassette, subfamily C, bacterial
LDKDTEEAVRQALEALKGQLTILAISHNRAMVSGADKVYQMTGGNAVLLSAAGQSDLAK